MPRIVVVDDSAMMRDILQRAFESAGFEVRAFEPTAVIQLVDQILEADPGVVLSDYAMPSCNGFTLAKVLLQALPKVPVVILTAHREPDVLASLQKLSNVKEILQKPVSNHDLVELCTKLCEGAA
jgi:FixJ family two-component response regulator